MCESVMKANHSVIHLTNDQCYEIQAPSGEQIEILEGKHFIVFSWGNREVMFPYASVRWIEREWIKLDGE